MKLLHVIASADPAGGGPIEGLVRQDQATRGLPPRRLVTLDPPDAPFLKDFPMAVTALGEPRGSGRPTLLQHYRYSPRFIPWLRSHAADYDAIVVHGLWNYAAFGAAMVLPGGATPYFTFTHGMMDPWFRSRYPLKHLAKQAFWLVAEGRLLAGARAVLFTTQEERELARGVFLGHRYREAVVGYGTAAAPASAPAQTEALLAAAPALKDRRYLLFLSRIHEKKGVDLLIQAFAGIAKARPDLDLVIAGPGDPALVAALKRQARSLGVDGRIHWPGMLQGDAKWGAFRGAEAFALTSHQENFGVVVAEALACGTPVLISDKVNIWREIEAAGAGLVAPDTAAGAVSLLARWSAMTPQEIEHMRTAGVQLFRESFDVAQTAPALIDFIRSMR